AVAHTALGGSTCTQSGYLRCDDPQGTSQESTPAVTPTEVLNEIDVNVAGSGSFQLLHKYLLAYSQAAGGTSTDNYNGQSVDTAGYLLLGTVTEYGDSGTLAYPTQTFTYSLAAPETYEDSQYSPSPSGNCGPAWNTGKRYDGTGSCVLWYQTSNNYYLSES